MAFLGTLMHLFQKNISSMSGMLFLMFMQSLVQYETKEGKWEGYYGEKNYLDTSFLDRQGLYQFCIQIKRNHYDNAQVLRIVENSI